MLDNLLNEQEAAGWEFVSLTELDGSDYLVVLHKPAEKERSGVTAFY